MKSKERTLHWLCKISATAFANTSDSQKLHPSSYRFPSLVLLLRVIPLKDELRSSAPCDKVGLSLFFPDNQLPGRLPNVLKVLQ